MSPGCCAFGCKNKSTEYKLYRIPNGKNDQARRRIWISRINRLGQLLLHDGSRLCQAHFKPCQFEKKIPGKLKPNAVPSIFFNHSERKDMKKRSSERQLANSVGAEFDPNCHAISIDRGHITPPPNISNYHVSASSSADNLMTPEVISSLSTSAVLQSSLSTSDDKEVLKKRIDLLTGSLCKLGKEKNELESRYSMLFNADQIDFLRNPSKKIKWSIETVKKALQLRLACGSNGYNVLLSQGFPLPPIKLSSEITTKNFQRWNSS